MASIKLDVPVGEFEVSKATVGNQLIYSFFIESTKLVPLFEKFVKTTYDGDKFIKLRMPTDEALANHIIELTEHLFSSPKSTISPQQNELRHNGYKRMYDYELAGNNLYPKPENYNTGFHTNLLEVTY